MRHFPIFIDLADKHIVVSGAGECAESKLRLLLKTEANISVFGVNPTDNILKWRIEGKIVLIKRSIQPLDKVKAALFYAANDDVFEDARVAAIGKAFGGLVNIVDNLTDSQFITPALVDRDPVTVAIGTEGTAPVLARQIKKQIEELLPVNLGLLAKIGQEFRPAVSKLSMGRKRRDVWSKFYSKYGSKAIGVKVVKKSLQTLIDKDMNEPIQHGEVSLIGAGPGDPELLTLKARNLLHEADVVIHDQLVASSILELVRREAVIIETGKRGFGASWRQEDINKLMIKYAHQNLHVVRLKSGDPVIFGRLDEEMTALENANVPFSIIPGITSASAAAAMIGQSLTKRGRNSSFRILTGHDIGGFANHDWQILAKPNSTAAIYMGKRAAQFISARLLMFGASKQTPITIVENISRTDQRIFATSIGALPSLLTQVKVDGPAVFLLGLTPRKASEMISALEKKEFA